MEKIKEFWNKLKYWQKGGVIGLIFGIFIQIFMFMFFGSYNNLLNWLHFGALVISSLSSPLNDQTGKIIPFLTIILWYGLLGLILGSILNLIKKKVKNRFILWISFSFVIVIIIVILYIMNLFLIESIFKGIST